MARRCVEHQMRPLAFPILANAAVSVPHFCRVRWVFAHMPGERIGGEGVATLRRQVPKRPPMVKAVEVTPAALLKWRGRHQHSTCQQFRCAPHRTETVRRSGWGSDRIEDTRQYRRGVTNEGVVGEGKRARHRPVIYPHVVVLSRTTGTRSNHHVVRSTPVLSPENGVACGDHVERPVWVREGGVERKVVSRRPLQAALNQATAVGNGRSRLFPRPCCTVVRNMEAHGGCSSRGASSSSACRGAPRCCSGGGRTRIKRWRRRGRGFNCRGGGGPAGFSLVAVVLWVRAAG